MSSTVNLIASSVVFICCRSFSLCSVCCITKVSSTYLFYNLGEFSIALRATSSKCSTYILATWWLTGDPIAMPPLPHSTDPGMGSRYYEDRMPDVL